MISRECVGVLRAYGSRGPQVGRRQADLHRMGLLRLPLVGILLLCFQGAQAAAGAVSTDLLATEVNPKASLLRAREELRSSQVSHGPAARLQAALSGARGAAALGLRSEVTELLAIARAEASRSPSPDALALIPAVDAESLIDEGAVGACETAIREARVHRPSVLDPLAGALVDELVATTQSLCLKRWAEAEIGFRQAMEVYKTHGLIIRQAATSIGMSYIYDALRDPAAAIRERSASYALVEHLDAPYMKSWLGWRLALSKVIQGKYDEAESLFSGAGSLAKAIGDETGDVLCQQGLALVAIGRKEWAAASRLLLNVQPKLKLSSNLERWAAGQAYLANALAHQGVTELDGYLGPAKSVIDQLPPGSPKVEILTQQAEAMRAAGHHERASALFEEIGGIERTLFQRARENQVAYLAVRYELDKRQADVSRLMLQSQLGQAKEQRLLAVLALAAVTVLSGAYFLIAQVRQRRHFAKLALVDALTGAPNRRAILDHVSNLANSGQDAVVAMIDIDHFKRVNDSFGHDVGDEVLRAFYQAATAAQPIGERIGRVGGEEWLLVCEGHDAEIAKSAFRRIRERLHSRPIPGLPVGHLVTYSMGVAPLFPGRAVSDVLCAADRALYVAKAAGRDRLIVEAVATTESPPLTPDERGALHSGHRIEET